MLSKALKRSKGAFKLREMKSFTLYQFVLMLNFVDETTQYLFNVDPSPLDLSLISIPYIVIVTSRKKDKYSDYKNS